MSVNTQQNNNLLFCTDGYGAHNWFSVRKLFRKCSVWRSRKFRWWTTMVMCRECNLLCHGKCFSKLVEDMNATEVQDAIPATEAPDAIPPTEAPDAIPEMADHQLQLIVHQANNK
eukprot:XP_016662501.1 PREDICTED: uncharacterized protein LOC107884588 isoform X2 [Acyrthosiphon pisum]